jgi:hypothetical protein
MYKIGIHYKMGSGASVANMPLVQKDQGLILGTPKPKMAFLEALISLFLDNGLKNNEFMWYHVVTNQLKKG